MASSKNKPAETLEDLEAAAAVPGDDTKPPSDAPSNATGPVASGSVRCKVGPGSYVNDGKWYAEGSVVDAPASDAKQLECLTPIG